ncbi:MAG: VOC family protein, partial [Bdellovibrionales bacterium]|nr:VOC family protein [Bdellovibrionales bacterium]
MDKILVNAVQFLKELSLNPLIKQVPQHWDLDHICLRVETQKEYDEFKTHFESFAKLLIESKINGRMISTFQLNKPIQFNDWVVDIIELPEPKPNRPYPTGFEHAEFVCDVTFEELKTLFPDGQFDADSTQWNKEFSVSNNEITIKFHHQSLKSVIQVESQPKCDIALRESGIFNSLKALHPVVVGTIPLGINLIESDFDILLFSDNLSQSEVIIREKFESFPGFEISQTQSRGEPAVVARFSIRGVPFELF